MSPLVVMMLMLYAVLVAISLTLWAILTLRDQRRPSDLSAVGDAQTRVRDLPMVPPAFAAKSSPVAEPQDVRAQRGTAGREERTARTATDAPTEGRGSRSKLRVTVKPGDEKSEKGEREDAFERYRTAGDEIDF